MKFALLVAGVLLTSMSLQAGTTNRLNGVVALVDESVITAQQVYSKLEDVIPSLQRRYADQPRKYQEELGKLESAALDSLIENQLILSAYKKAGYNIPDSFIDDQFQEDIVRRFGDRVAFIKTLQAEGKTIEEAKKEFRDMLIIQIMSQQKIKNQTTISPYKIERYYQEHQDKFTQKDQVKLRMIIIPAQSRTDSVAIGKATDIYKEIENGASFEDMAKKYSVGVQAADGGLMGWNTREELRKELVATAFSIKPGTVSQPVITDDAIFILKVEERKDAHVQPLSEVRDEIEETLKAEESALRRKQWIDSIREKSFIRLF